MNAVRKNPWHPGFRGALQKGLQRVCFSNVRRSEAAGGRVFTNSISIYRLQLS